MNQQSYEFIKNYNKLKESKFFNGFPQKFYNNRLELYFEDYRELLIQEGCTNNQRIGEEALCIASIEAFNDVKKKIAKDYILSRF